MSTGSSMMLVSRHGLQGKPMLQSLSLRDFTVFKRADLTFAPGLNVIVGANGTGKTHLLKLPYAVMAMGAEEGRKHSASPTKTLLQDCIQDGMPCWGSILRILSLSYP